MVLAFTSSSTERHSVVRLDSDGSWDLSFKPLLQRPDAHFAVTTVAITPSGDILGAGDGVIQNGRIADGIIRLRGDAPNSAGVFHFGGEIVQVQEGQLVSIQVNRACGSMGEARVDRGPGGQRIRGCGFCSYSCAARFCAWRILKGGRGAKSR